MYRFCLSDYACMVNIPIYSYHNITMNYAKWQLLYNEYNSVGAAALSNDEINKVHKTGFPVAETVSQACAQAVEKIVPFARPFVEEFVTAKVVDQVNSE